jgi:acetolactate synthase regulatory subunit
MGGQIMTWRFDVVATAQERLLSRILQVLEVQRVSIHSFAGHMNEARARVTFVISSQEDKAYRIEALLYRLEGIDLVSVMKEIESR